MHTRTATFLSTRVWHGHRLRATILLHCSSTAVSKPYALHASPGVTAAVHIGCMTRIWFTSNAATTGMIQSRSPLHEGRGCLSRVTEPLSHFLTRRPWLPLSRHRTTVTLPYTKAVVASLASPNHYRLPYTKAMAASLASPNHCHTSLHEGRGCLSRVTEPLSPSSPSLHEGRGCLSRVTEPPSPSLHEGRGCLSRVTEPLSPPKRSGGFQYGAVDRAFDVPRKRSRKACARGALVHRFSRPSIIRNCGGVGERLNWQTHRQAQAHVRVHPYVVLLVHAASIRTR